MPKVFKIDGQLYRMVERTTLANDFYVMKQIRASGLADCAPGEGESAEDFAVRLLYGVVASGAPFELLGGLLLPEGVSDDRWTPEQAETTAAMLGKVSNPEDKAVVQKILVSTITDFFREGLRYLKPSRSASKAQAQPGEKETGAAPSGPDCSLTLESGATWCANWPITRWIATRILRGGR